MAAGFDPARLAAALDRINRARRLGTTDDARPLELMAGFEALLEADEAHPPARELEGASALAELRALLAREGSETGAEALHEFLEPVLERLIEGLLDDPGTRLAAYGSLQPGEANHARVSTLVGEWIDGTVGGTLHDRGWGTREGFPGLEWHEPEPRVPLRVFSSSALPGVWDRLDAFEGSGYRRILVPVETECGILVCNLYELSPDA